MNEALNASGIFKGCSAQELQEIARICQRVTYKSGERILKAGRTAQNLYIIAEGAVDLRIEITFENITKEIIVEHQFKGNVFGWSAVTEPHIYTLSAIAMQDSELLMLNFKEINSLCEKSNHLGYVLMRNITEIISERFKAMQWVFIEMMHEKANLKDLEHYPITLEGAVSRFEKNLIFEALKKNGGNKTQAAKQLQIPTSTLSDTIKKLKIEYY